MEISEVRKQLLATIDGAKRAAAERRVHTDQMARDFEVFLERTAVPLFRQVANALKAEGHFFHVFTPSSSVRLMSDKSAEDYIEISLDTTGANPAVIGRSCRNRGRRVIESERALGSGAVSDLDENQVLRFVLEELEPFVER